MATANPYGAALDPYAGDPTAALRARVMAQLGGASSDPAASTAATSSASPSTPSPSFYSATTTDTQSPAGSDNSGNPPPPATSQPTPTGTVPPNPTDPTDPRNAGTGGTYNEPAPGSDANQINGWYTTYLGRAATNDDMAYWLNQAKVNPGGLSRVQNLILNSPEAQAYAKRPGGSLNPLPPAAAATGGGAGAGAGTAAVTAPPTSAFTDQLRALLMSRLQSAQAPVDENSPQIQASVSAARDEATRQSEQERTALAENLYANGGLNTAAIPQQIQQSAERNAASVGTLRATLLMNAYNQKQQELENDLQLAFASGDAESARLIQAQIANLQATVQREGIGAGLAINAANQNATTVKTGAGA